MAASHEHAEIPFSGATSTRVLSMTSGKGGVGKSSITVNLAVALAQLGHRVAVIDADVYGFSIPGMLGVSEEPVLTDEQQIVPPIAHGVKAVSIGYFVEADKPVMWRGPMLQKALAQFLTDVVWGEADYLLIDMPPGTGDVALSMAQLLPNAEVFVITTPQPAAQTVAQRSGAMAREVGLSVAGIIENMSWMVEANGDRRELFGAGGGEALAKKLRAPLLAQIPFDSEIREGADAGAPVVIGAPTSDAAQVFLQLAKTIEQTTPRRVYRDELRVR